MHAVLDEEHYLKAGRPAGHVLWQGAWEHDPESGLDRLVPVFCRAGAAKRLKLIVRLRRFVIINVHRRPNLAGRSLGRALRELPDEWQLSCWCHRKWYPHPCGYYGDPKRQYRCSVRQIENYRQRISGPLLDRIDLHVEVPLVDFRELSNTSTSGNPSAVIRQRVIAARQIQNERFKKSGHTTNSAMNARQVRQHCQLDAQSTSYLEQAMEDMNFSARAHDRILKVARTLAGLEGSPNIRPPDILEAIQYRSLDQKLFA